MLGQLAERFGALASTKIGFVHQAPCSEQQNQQWLAEPRQVPDKLAK